MMLLNMVAVQLMIYFLKCYMTVILKWYFESIFIPKEDCADRPFEITYFSISGQHNLPKDFLWFPFRNDIWLSFWNALWLSFWNEGGKNFRTQNYFGQETQRCFIDENTVVFTFSYRKTVCIIKTQTENCMFI